MSRILNPYPPLCIDLSPDQGEVAETTRLGISVTIDYYRACTQTMQIDQRLKKETAVQHERLHECVDIQKMRQSLSEYARVLKAFYVAVAPLEACLANKCCRQSVDARTLDIFKGRLQKASWIETDLRALAQSLPADMSAERELPWLLSLSEERPAQELFAGCGYVMEGMTLGGKQIAREMSERFRLTGETGLRFFESYGAATGQQWPTFRAWLRNVSIDDDHVVKLACDTFEYFERCLTPDPVAAEDGATDA